MNFDWKSETQILLFSKRKVKSVTDMLKSSFDCPPWQVVFYIMTAKTKFAFSDKTRLHHNKR